MKKIIVLIIALAVKFNFASAADSAVVTSYYENSYAATMLTAKGGDDEKSRIKELRERKKALREEEKNLNQKLKIKKLEKQAKEQERKNKHKQVELDHQ
ncbi:MAG: hypothetical protein ACJ75J_06025 [Cytophagaceae bacterium]